MRARFSLKTECIFHTPFSAAKVEIAIKAIQIKAIILDTLLIF
jgi:hypothetical protein